LEVERAKEKAAEIMAMPPCWRIDSKLEQEAERIFKKASKAVEA
jgi:hypothetical protein